MKIYSRTGDGGKTGLGGGARVLKSTLRVEAYGDVDELNACLGVARAHVSHPEALPVLEEIQKDLLSMGAILSHPANESAGGKVSLEAADVTRLEHHIDHFQSQLPELRRFIIPGGTPGGAFLQQARAVCRRAERKLVALTQNEPVPRPLLAYLNRLSDLLFVVARVESQHQGVAEETW